MSNTTDQKVLTLGQVLNKLMLDYASNLLFFLFIAYILYVSVPYVLTSVAFTYFQYLVGLLVTKVIYNAVTKSMYLTLVTNAINIICVFCIIFLL